MFRQTEVEKEKKRLRTHLEEKPFISLHTGDSILKIYDVKKITDNKIKL